MWDIMPFSQLAYLKLSLQHSDQRVRSRPSTSLELLSVVQSLRYETNAPSISSHQRAQGAILLI